MTSFVLKDKDEKIVVSLLEITEFMFYTVQLVSCQTNINLLCNRDMSREKISTNKDRKGDVNRVIPLYLILIYFLIGICHKRKLNNKG